MCGWKLIKVLAGWLPNSIKWLILVRKLTTPAWQVRFKMKKSFPPSGLELRVLDPNGPRTTRGQETWPLPRNQLTCPKLFLRKEVGHKSVISKNLVVLAVRITQDKPRHGLLPRYWIKNGLVIPSSLPFHESFPLCMKAKWSQGTWLFPGMKLWSTNWNKFGVLMTSPMTWRLVSSLPPIRFFLLYLFGGHLIEDVLFRLDISWNFIKWRTLMDRAPNHLKRSRCCILTGPGLSLFGFWPPGIFAKGWQVLTNRTLLVLL